MEKKFRLFICSLFLCASSFAQWQDLSTWQGDFHAISMFNENAGLVVGNTFPEGETTLFRTIDGGNTWSEVLTGTAGYLPVVEVAGAGVAFAGISGNLMKTTDWGENWVTIAQMAPSDIVFTDSLNGYVSENNFVHKTTDGGATWIPVQISTADITITAMDFVSVSIGWVAVTPQVDMEYDSLLFKTTDGGMTWVSQLQESGSQGSSSIQFMDAQRGYCLGSYNNLYITIDGGTNWTEIINSNLVNGKLFFSSFLNGFFLSGEKSFLKTTSGGIIWDSQSIFSHGGLSSIDFVSATVLFGCGNQGCVYKSTDGGLTWQSVFKNTHVWLNRVFTSGPQHFDAFADHSDMILHSEDGGENMTISDSFGTMQMGGEDTHWLDEDHIWVAQRSTVAAGIKSTDGGVSWNVMNCSTCGYNTTNIHFISSEIGYSSSQLIVSGNPVEAINKSTDGGNSWSQVIAFSDLHIEDIWFTSESRGFLCGEGTLLGTTDGGISWSEVNHDAFGSEITLRRIFFYNAQLGFAVGEGGLVLKTTDGGMTWKDFSISTINWIESIFFTDPQTGYAPAVGTIYKTTDGGLTWGQQQSPLPYALTDIYFSDANHGYIVGAYGTVLKTDNAGGILDNATEATTGKIDKVFPNPFQKSFTVQLDNEWSGSGTLSLFDPAGRRIIMQEILKSSRFQEWNMDAGDLPAGSYILQIEVGENKASKLLIRE